MIQVIKSKIPSQPDDCVFPPRHCREPNCLKTARVSYVNDWLSIGFTIAYIKYHYHSDTSTCKFPSLFLVFGVGYWYQHVHLNNSSITTGHCVSWVGLSSTIILIYFSFNQASENSKCLLKKLISSKFQVSTSRSAIASSGQCVSPTLRCLFLFPQTIIACGISYGFNFQERFNVDVVGVMVSG